MHSTSPPANDGLPARASEWLVALADHPEDETLRAGLQRWLAASPANRRDWEEMSALWQGLGEIGTLAGEDRGTTRERLPARRVRRRALGAAAGLAVALGLAFAWGPDLLLRLEADQVTATAEVRSLVLDDGSRVELAPRSAVAVDFSARERRLRLLQGRAFFVVAAGDRRPFIVATRGAEARDIGTAFDVATADDATEVAVREGIVEVTRPGAPGAAELRAGDWVRIERSGATGRGQVEAESVGAWRRGRLMVENRPVAAVVDALRPYFPGTVVLVGDRLARQPLTGAYTLSDPVGALRAVASAQGASVHRVSPWLIVIAGD
ncbi:FecR family protein [Reyranella sp.]|uniref:FecR family protein n=1 Tax=Reyranella sp. TaxID=1929291 RepID=UPI003BA90C3B